MINISFDITEENTRKVQTELLINILGAQKAGIEVLIEMIAVDRKEAELFMDGFDKKSKKYSNEILEHIYATMGIVDIDKIIES